jgi:hypothetical protein
MEENDHTKSTANLMRKGILRYKLILIKVENSTAMISVQRSGKNESVTVEIVCWLFKNEILTASN